MTLDLSQDGWTPDEPEPLADFDLKFASEKEYREFYEKVQKTLNQHPFTEDERVYYRTHIIEFAHLVTRQTEPDFKLSEVQTAYLLAFQDMSNKNIALLTPRGGGKTFLDAMVAVWSVVCFDRYGVVILGGSKDQSYNVWEYIHGFFIDYPRLALLVDGKIGKGRLRLKNKSWVIAIAASPTAARGKHPSCLILDEVVEIKSKIITAARGQLTTSSFGTMQHGRLVMTTTAHNGPSIRFFQKIFEGGWRPLKKEPKPAELGPQWNGFLSFQWSQLQCPWFDQDNLRVIKMTVSAEEWKVEYMGEFGTLTGLVFNPEDVDAITDDTLIEEPDYEYASPIYQAYMGVDWGFSKYPTAVVIVQMQSDGKIRVIHVTGDVGIRFNVWHQRIKKLYERYNVIEINADNSHISDNQALHNLGLSVNPVPFGARILIRDTKGRKSVKSRKAIMVKNTQLIIEKQYIEVHPQFEILVDQLYGYHWIDPKDEESGESKLTKENCDYVEALMLALLPFSTRFSSSSVVAGSAVVDGIPVNPVSKAPTAVDFRVDQVIHAPAHHRMPTRKSKKLQLRKRRSAKKENIMDEDEAFNAQDEDHWIFAMGKSKGGSGY